MMRAYVAERDSAVLRAEMGAGAANIAEVITEVRERLPDLPPSPKLEPELARFRFFDSLTTFFKTAAKQQPLVLFLDDLQWADTPSLLLLQFLAHELSESRLLIIGTCREGEPERQSVLSQTLGALARVPKSQTLHLRALAERDVARFIELTTGQLPADELVTAVYRETEGHPFFMTEIVRLLTTEEPHSALSPSSFAADRAECD